MSETVSLITVKIDGLIEGLDVSIAVEFETIAGIKPFIAELKAEGLTAKPRYSDKKATFEPFRGTVESIEPTKTQTGKDMFIANVRPIVGEGEPQKDLFAVKYMPPKSTWRVGDIVNVTKNEKGWAEMKEDDQEPPF